MSEYKKGFIDGADATAEQIEEIKDCNNKKFFEEVIEPVLQKYSVGDTEPEFLPDEQKYRAIGAGNVVCDIYEAVYGKGIISKS